ncbi:Hydroquinone glucosyltransferase [Platanthera zijinensis]|uniref:Glycosyltransferase n=1 Tax=Platanthera zijinensis TaxID=2320716 RepID=A0AAP0G652_9ASPA
MASSLITIAGRPSSAIGSPPRNLHLLLPSPGIGHLIPFVELAKRLVHQNLTATIITFSDLSSHVQQSLLSSLPVGISSVSLPLIPLDDLPANAHVVTRLSHMIARSIPFLRLILQNLQKFNTRIVAYITDLFGGDTLSVATELSIPRYVFFTSNFFYFSFFHNLPHLYSESGGVHHTLSLPGCVRLHARDFSRSAIDKESEEFAWMIRHAKQIDRADGIMVNSFEAVEGDAAKFLKERGKGKPPIFPVGPLTSKVELESKVDCRYMQWLDRQPDRSVLFISLGSGGTLSMEQTREMASGLEMSRQRFLWIVRAPAGSDASANYFSAQGGGRSELLDFLPPGFVERTKDTGMIVHSWAQQEKILAHEAIGGFLSHCGWNSTLESMVNGVPMIAWPLYSEQPMNAVLLVEGLKVALRPTPQVEKLVNRDEIAEAVRRLMEGDEGKEARKRMQEVKQAATAAVGVEGASYMALTSIVNIWKASGL